MEGTRAVFVASCSTRTPDSRWSRVQGLQLGPSRVMPGAADEAAVGAAVGAEGAEGLTEAAGPDAGVDGGFMQVTCPPELGDDRQLRIALPDGREFDVEVPPGLETGGTFLVGPFPTV